MGSPPPEGSKKVELKLRSNNSIVIAPAKTGRESSKRTVVIKIDQISSGWKENFIKELVKFIIVTMKFTAPRIEEIPARCKERIARSTETDRKSVV